jgi:hypothetical protein
VSTMVLEGSISKSYAYVSSRLSALHHRAEWWQDRPTRGSAGASIDTGVRVEPVAMRPSRSEHYREDQVCAPEPHV